MRKRRGQQPISDSGTNDYDLISSLLPLPSPSSHADEDEDEEEDSETDDILREATLFLLRLTYAQAHGQLESMDQELELLRSAPPLSPSRRAPSEKDATSKKKEEDDMWKLDAPQRTGGSEALLDSSGKVRGALHLNRDFQPKLTVAIATSAFHYPTSGFIQSRTVTVTSVWSRASSTNHVRG